MYSIGLMITKLQLFKIVNRDRVVQKVFIKPYGNFLATFENLLLSVQFFLPTEANILSKSIIQY